MYFSEQWETGRFYSSVGMIMFLEDGDWKKSLKGEPVKGNIYGGYP